MIESKFKDHVEWCSKEVEKWPQWKKDMCLPRANIAHIDILEEEEEPEYDSPNGSVWIVAVDYAGRVTVLQAPNIHHSFLDNGPEAEYLGLPPDVDEMDPGVYRWTCSYNTHIDWESGHVDDFDFEIAESVLLWSPDDIS